MFFFTGFGFPTGAGEPESVTSSTAHITDSMFAAASAGKTAAEAKDVLEMLEARKKLQ